jgi:hypothetical protein
MAEIEYVRVYDPETGTVSRVPRREVGEGYISVPVDGGEIWARGFIFDFQEGDGPEPVIHPLRDAVEDISEWGLEPCDFSYGLPRMCFMQFADKEDADYFAEIADVPGMRVRPVEEQRYFPGSRHYGETETQYRVEFPREAIPDVIAKCRAWNAENRRRAEEQRRQEADADEGGDNQ